MSARASFRTKVIGLTGGVAAGKNFVAEIFAKNGAAVFDADKEVHTLLELDKSTISAVKKISPESLVAGKIDRKILGKIVFADEKKLKLLEKILHPKVRKSYQKLLREARSQKLKMLVLNIPLLLESEAYDCDYVLAITASKSMRKKRFLERSPHADAKKFTQIYSRQLSDAERKKRSDFVIKNSGSKDETVKQVEMLIKKLTS